MSTQDLSQLFPTTPSESRGAQRMFTILNDPTTSQITVDRHDRITYIDNTGPQRPERVFANDREYKDWLNQLMAMTDVGYTDVDTANTSVIEGSFNPELIPVHGSIHICTREITRDEPSLTVRKQPISLISLDHMLKQGMMNEEMRLFLEQSVRARSNMLLSGGSGAGKTTLARALSYFIDPWQRVISVEEIDELHLYDRLTNCVALTTYRKRDQEGRVIRETSLDDLVREGLRMRGDRVWVGETRGKEAYALVKACNSGHDGSVTTMHADTSKQAIKQVITYVMESGLAEQPAREQVAQAFDLIIQISKVRMDKRVITEICQVEKVLEGTEQRLNLLWKYDPATESFLKVGTPTAKFYDSWVRYGVNPIDGPPPIY